MESRFEVIGKTVYNIVTFSDGTEWRIKVRDCNNIEQAKAVANYYKVRKE